MYVALEIVVKTSHIKIIPYKDPSSHCKYVMTLRMFALLIVLFTLFCKQALILLWLVAYLNFRQI